ncbi:MAG: HEAT repeat domain-containing protein [Polyangiaceae bacterium]|jgi:hypothetical protein
MRRPASGVKLLISVLIQVVGCFGSGPAVADGRVSFLAERVTFPPPAGKPDDFRVRTNAALALGATDSDEAVAPLCGALSDPSAVVRQAAAVGVRRLGRRSALPCLQQRLNAESNASVKLDIQRAIDVLGASGAALTPAPATTAAKYYVALGHVANSTSRSEADVQRVVSAAVISKFAALGGYEVAPSGEATDRAKDVIAKRKLKGFFLAVHVAALEYTSEGLRGRVEIAVFSYPSKELRGEVPASATLPGVRPGDTGSEDRLLAAVSEHAIELFATNFR